MDIISHSLTGVAVGTVFATVSGLSWKKKSLIILAGGFGGALPDLDAISLWSKFDATIGAFFNLKRTGKEIYFGKEWYSHHAALHSILAPLLLIMVSFFIHSLRKKGFSFSKLMQQWQARKFSFMAFFFGFLFHLLEDMPTPASVWGGVNLFFPGSTYIGGFGKIWWWNNYDLVLIILSVIVMNLFLNATPNRFNALKAKASIAIFTLGFTLFLIQINTRTVDFSYSGHTSNYAELEAQSKRIQKEILGDKLFYIMNEIDNKIPLNF